MLNNPAARKAVSGLVEPPARLLLRMHVSPDAVTLVGTAGAVTVALVCLPQGLFVLAVVFDIGFLKTFFRLFLEAAN